MILSWNEIKDRALNFSKEWAETINEEADAKPFLDAFFNVFGITRKKIGTFEHRVKKLSDADGYIDLLWKGTILVEMKSRGKNLDKAFEQAKDYTHGLKAHELPKYILVSDFYTFRLYDTEEQNTIEFTINELVHNVQHFGYLLGYQKKVYKEQDPINIKAAELMGSLHDKLKDIGYEGHPLEVYLVRLLFCLFAEDTTIFNKQQFQDFIEYKTNEDGSDLAARLNELFQVLNTPNNKRFKNLDEDLQAFPYVNGKLFEEHLPIASFDKQMRKHLLDACIIDWSKISPAIFGSMFQSVMNPKERRNLGAHYTSESNILKLIKPLFLDELWAEFESIKHNKNKLNAFHVKISKLKFLDPACGCGNFLIITYRELRLLELEILRNLYKTKQGFRQGVLDIGVSMLLDVDMVYGIEYEEFPARIAEVAMWLIDHQMNMLVSQEFGQYVARLPLKKSAHITHADALETDWEAIVNKNELSFIIGNPPFIGARLISTQQKVQINKLFDSVKGSGVLDYVSAWYLKSAKYIQDTNIRVAFVSTNSIVQGEQTAILWKPLLEKYNIKIHFAHRSFKWNNEAKGNAAVHCIIVGFGIKNIDLKKLFYYDSTEGIAHETIVKNINPYLIEGKDIIVSSRTKPLCDAPEIIKGSETTDSGHFMLSNEDVIYLRGNYPSSEKFIRPFIGGGDFLNGKTRYCLYLKSASITEIKNIPFIYDRINKVKEFREKSPKKRTREWASFPTLFSEDRQPQRDFLMIPKVSSERRNYIPFAIVSKDILINNTASYIDSNSLYIFGVLQSKMHMSWVNTVCGRMKSDYVYSNSIVYNNYPWPKNPSAAAKKKIEDAAQQVLDVRAKYTNSSLADLYDPLTMPPDLVKAHNTLDKAVDAAYSKQKFDTEAKRMEFLFNLYEEYINELK